MRRPSLKIRITAWFALMMFVIEALVLSFLLAVNGTIVTNDPESRLVRVLEHNADRVKYKNRQFRYDHIHYYRSGVYTVLYDADGNPAGHVPGGVFAAQPLPLSGDAVRTVTCGEQTFYVYDVHVDMMVGSVWLRGVIDANAKGGVMRVIMPLAWSLLPVLLVLSVIGGYFIASRALRPVRQLTAAANAISDGQDLKARIGLPHTKGSDEIYQLSASFDNMFDRLERSFEAEQRFTSDASHELRTPTTVILAACEDARKNARTPADYQAALDVVDRQAHKMSELIGSMLEITRLDQGHAEAQLGVCRPVRSCHRHLRRADHGRAPRYPHRLRGRTGHFHRHGCVSHVARRAEPARQCLQVRHRRRLDPCGAPAHGYRRAADRAG